MKSPRGLSESNIIKYWNLAAEKIKPYHEAPSTRIYFNQEKKLINKYFHSLKGKSLLKTDLWNEAKNTQILQYIMEKGAEVYGVDISYLIVQQALNALKNCNGQPKVLTTDIRRLPFPNNSFDYIYSMGTVEHVPDSEKAFQELYRVLKKGGLAILGVPNKFDLFLRPFIVYILQKLGIYSFGYERSFSKKELLNLLKKENFNVQSLVSILFMPGILRILDIFLFIHMRPLTKFSKILLAPFTFLYNHFSFFSQRGYLIAYVVKKKKDA